MEALVPAGIGLIILAIVVSALREAAAMTTQIDRRENTIHGSYPAAT